MNIYQLIEEFNDTNQHNFYVPAEMLIQFFREKGYWLVLEENRFKHE